ncbi:MAG: UDP-N-acetylmuramate dehydrogenase [Aeromicrobium sp.]|uniref:UDP-N-acetylmuramate dehydrogenase n=1 Tax=Aeromicrobium sp. TaxID=1871063 RepID=UPI0025BDC2DA|nr:UDP-N-acetylmuramate dehydrogenase [Aeromicrobium sp.]MCK5891382.1 UDP-N-acetylmuramate dehydrogenase [Aeromicrobium sp.]MDF1704472.1 UDP-N-acetylmuramate dehydrogenase [Aeromicrobium sp.]
MRLSEVTTLRLGGPASEVVEATTADELVDAVREADAAGTPVLLVAGGSNLVVADGGFDGRVVLVRTSGVVVDQDACSGATVTVAAGESWDGLVARAVEQEWVGIEALAGIPGSVGATPVQNVGAYGQEVAQSIIRVRTWDRHEGAVRTLTADQCGFGYRTSRFKTEPDRHLLLDVTFQLRLGSLGAPVAYAELARALGVEVGERAPSVRVREAVLALRRGKGMVLDPADHDTWSAGSFFTNPVLTPAAAARLPEDAPRFAQPDGTVKTSAAWLISQAGFERGHGTTEASLSTKHALALTNRGSASTADLLALAREVRAGVRSCFGIELEPEPNLVGCAL